MNMLLNLYHLQLKYDRLNELKREDRKIKLRFSSIESSAKLKFLQWKKMQKSFQDSQVSLKQKEAFLKDLEHQAEDYTKTMYDNTAPKNSKELSDLQRKVQLLKERIAITESDVIECMNQIENEEKSFQELDIEFSRLKEEFQQEKAFMKARTQEIAKEISGVEKEIEQSREKLDQELVEIFDKSFSRGQQSAVVFVENGACSGCGTTQSQRLIDAIYRKPDEIHYCENCNRIIVRKND
jgi:uncharacterized protein